ncbi:MAG: IMP dehydrogenase [Candidatus Woesearchaeota archaeon]
MIREGLTYSDVLLVPKKTPLSSRKEAKTSTYFTKNIKINSPLVSANMATVTEHKMAIALAREGGIGVIHQFLSLDEQVEEVRKVKKSTSYVIENPTSVSKDITISEAVSIMDKEIVTSLLVKENDELIGIFTSRDYLFEDNWDKKIFEVMTPKEKLITAPDNTTIDQAKHILHEHRIEKLPLVKDGKVTGLMTTQDIKKIEFWPNASRDEKGRLLVAAAVGIKDSEERIQALIDVGVDVIVLDIAHAHSIHMIEKLKQLKSKFKIDIMVGNIATADAAKDLIEAGADGLKVGVGPGSICSTRLMSGAGVPQLTAVMDVASVASQHNVPICADGGIQLPGDIPKALAAGSDTVMCGSLFAGCKESPGIIMTKDGRRYKRYIGSASYENSHNRAEKETGKKVKEKLDVFVEGVSNLVEYKGTVSDIISTLMNGLRSGISYCGATDIPELKKNAEFIRITDAARVESATRGKKIAD